MQFVHVISRVENWKILNANRTGVSFVISYPGRCQVKPESQIIPNVTHLFRGVPVNPENIKWDAAIEKRSAKQVASNAGGAGRGGLAAGFWETRRFSA